MGVSRRQHILDSITDAAGCDIFYYDRKEDEDLPRGSVEAALNAGEITLREMIDHFDRTLRKAAKEYGYKGTE